MKDLVLSIIGFFVFATFLVVAIWFSAFLLLFVFAASFFFATYIFLRGYYLRWKYGNSFGEKPPENSNSNQVGQNTTIIDVEYTEVKNPKDGL
jgi:predicted membrane protein